VKRIFDASSIFEIAKSGDSSPILDEDALTLTPYELGNILTKHVTLTHKLTMSEAEDLRKILNRMLRTMNLHPLDRIEQEVLKTAVEMRLSYYDESYLHAAKELNAELVTEDKRLAEAAKRLGVPNRSVTTL
jgi:predicted nucleic acid-binding protein